MTSLLPRRPTVLALDLEGTLISNAMSQIPRPGLAAFLTRCEQLFERIVVVTTVREPLFREIAQFLVEEGCAPSWFASVEYVNWSGATKDLSVIPGIQAQQALLVDDYEVYVHPGQEGQWVRVDLFESPYSESDRGLASVLEVLQQRLA